MKLQLEWTRAFALADARRQNLLYSTDSAKLPTAAGVYVFGRRYGGVFEALYVGKANNLRSRIKGQWKNLPLMLHLQNAKSGKRVLLCARFKPRPGQRLQKCLPLLERALIRYFLAEGHDLVNMQGTRIRRHEIESAGKHPKRFIPSLMFLDRTKGE